MEDRVTADMIYDILPALFREHLRRPVLVREQTVAQCVDHGLEIDCVIHEQWRKQPSLREEPTPSVRTL